MIFLKRDAYVIEKNVEKILRGEASDFLTLFVCHEVRRNLKRQDYGIFCPYEEAEKLILYGGRMPQVQLYRIQCYDKDKLTHPAILGSLFGLHISDGLFGDIVFYQGDFYVYLLKKISMFVVDNFLMVGHSPVKLQEVPLDFLKDYRREYEKLELIVASSRIDAVISKIIGCNRKKVQGKIHEKLVLLNGRLLERSSYLLQVGDIFSIRGCGKYRYQGNIGRTKKNNLIILVEKYVSH